MEELQLTLTPSRVDQRNFGVMLSNWRVGQVLNALVVDRMPSGDLLLNLGGKEFVTPLDLAVQAGSRLQLEVQQIQPQVTLKVLGNARNATLSQMTQSFNGQALATGGSISSVDGKPASITTLLAEIPKQSALRALLSQTPTLSSLISALSAQSLQTSALSSTALAAAIGRSGLFNEANLVGDRSNRVSESSKTQLTQIQRAIGELSIGNLNVETRASLTTLSDLTNAALANLTQQQLISMPQDGGGQRWCFGLPLVHDGRFVDLQMIVERDEHSSEVPGDEATWRVDLSLTLPEIGPLRVMLTMRGREVSVVFNSDSPRVRDLADVSFGQLKERMILSDFRVKSLSSQAMVEAPLGPLEMPGSFGGFEARV